MKIKPISRMFKVASLACVAALSVNDAVADNDHSKYQSFNRVAVFPVLENTSIDVDTNAEIIAASKDGLTLVYTDSETESLGFVDISNPAKPTGLGVLPLSGEPTSVAVAGKYALAAVNTSLNFVNTSGELVVVDMDQQTVVATLDLGGQPDSVAVSPDGRYAAVVIENERDEDLGEGEPPQAPSGFLVIVDLVGKPSEWTTRKVDLSGVADLFPQDAEPEYVDINQRNIAVVTMQENNHIVLVKLKTGKIIRDFNAGTVDLDQVDATEEDPALISLTESLSDVPREADGVSWISNRLFATADEGDLFGGSRGFTIYNKKGKVKFNSGNSNEHLAVRLGHYPDDRSGNKGNELENVEFGRYGHRDYLFVGSERSSLVFVYRLIDGRPYYKQTLPAGAAPEGLLAIPSRNLLVVASEEDDRGDKLRSVLNIYRLERGTPEYPTVVSKNRREEGTPIPWGALSGLAFDRYNPFRAYTIHDSFYQQSRIFAMNLRYKPAVIGKEIILRDTYGALADVQPELVNADGTVNLDQEGIATSRRGGFWIASEGDDAPVFFRNLLVKVAHNGDIQRVVTLPESTTARLIRFGFEGVAEVGRHVFVAFQREWTDDPDNHVRIGRYDMKADQWDFYYYPIELPESGNGGWVGLSDLAYLGNDEFAVIERDNQGGPDAVIKRIYRFSIAGLQPLADPAVGTVPSFPVVKKSLVRDLVPDLQATGGLVLEKIEGLAVRRNGDAIVVNDNDGVDDSNGETQLLRLRKLFR